MKRALITLALVLGALSFSVQATAAAPELPAAEQQAKKKDAKKKTQTVSFKTSIHCKNCVKKVQDNIAFEKGVKDLKVSLEDKVVTISYDPSKTDEAALAKALEKLGYTAEKTE